MRSKKIKTTSIYCILNLALIHQTQVKIFSKKGVGEDWNNNFMCEKNIKNLTIRGQGIHNKDK